MEKRNPLCKELLYLTYFHAVIDVSPLFIFLYLIEFYWFIIYTLSITHKKWYLFLNINDLSNLEKATKINSLQGKVTRARFSVGTAPE